MHFSREDILEIQQKLASYGFKDTDFELIPIERIHGDETIAVVANGQNRRLRLNDIQQYFAGEGGIVTKINVGDTEYAAVQGTISLPAYPSKLSELREDATHKFVSQSEKQTWNSKQAPISDLETIRKNAKAGSTAYQKPATGIPATDMTEAVQQSLIKADNALQSLPEFKTINGEEIVGHGDIVIDVDTTGLMPKVEGATKDAIPQFGADGTLKDSGYKLSDYYRKGEIDNKQRAVNTRLKKLEEQFVDLSEEDYEALVESGRVKSDVYYMIYEED